MIENPNIPNTTQVPNYVLDIMMSCLSGAEFKVLMFFIRQTYGFMKYNHKVSYSLKQISKGIKNTATGEYVFHGTGVSLRQVQAAIDKLNENYEIISVDSGNWSQGKASKYKLNLNSDIASKMIAVSEQNLPRQKLPRHRGKNCHDTVAKIATTPWQKLPYQETKRNQEKPRDTNSQVKEIISEYHRLLAENNVDTSYINYSILTKSIQSWIKGIDYKKIIECMPNYFKDKWAIENKFPLSAMVKNMQKYAPIKTTHIRPLTPEEVEKKMKESIK